VEAEDEPIHTDVDTRKSFIRGSCRHDFSARVGKAGGNTSRRPGTTELLSKESLKTPIET